MSHDLKTPLMTVMGMAELLEATEEDPERKNNFYAKCQRSRVSKLI